MSDQLDDGSEQEYQTGYGGQETTYDENAGDTGDFVNRHVAKVRVDEQRKVNEVGKVVDLLNYYSGDEIREMVLDD